ncbi:hypothetical protein GCM10011514_38080 [Emticicia aquatilis]|uniref:DUF4194 domain-containing protein n=1 Tax=Emticicia aquatilis TaxID=1537369 RepID=A0A917DUL0_9BACT|nr:DUF4194 domain-containing protein [Emticicia aquatilis]GGD70384.1 hypothetical protein GCM10011514_38080 [Emticicia aquatilis]
MEPRKLPEYNPAIVSLYKGVMYQEDKYWYLLLRHQTEIRKHFEQVGLGIYIDEAEGFAHIIDLELHEDQSDFPKLIEKRQLNYYTSLLCVLLRKKMAEQIQTSSETQVRISKQEIVDLMQGFLLINKNDESKTQKKVDESINKLKEYGFLRELKNDEDEFEIRRILISFVNIDFINELEQKMKDYLKNIGKDDTEHN